MLTMPVFGSAANGDQAVVAVIQLLNKSSGPFDSEDVEFMTTFMNIVGPILEQSSLYQNIKKRSNAHSEANEFGDGSNSRSKAKGSLSTIGDAIVEGDEEESCLLWNTLYRTILHLMWFYQLHNNLHMQNLHLTQTDHAHEK